MNWHLDWVTFTVWGDDIIEVFDLWYADKFRSLVDQGHGGRFYKSTHKTDKSITVRTDPISGREQHATIEFPGEACQMIGLQGMREFYYFLLNHFERVRCNRIDVAFDYCEFTVQDVTDCLLDNNLRSYFKRSTIKVYNKPFEKNELGGLGTSGVTIGARSSTRYMRVYDKHGYTRLEIEFKHEKAEQVANDVLLSRTDKDALRMAMGHVADYIEFYTEWWDHFMNNFDRLYKTLPETVKEMTLEGIKQWFEDQIASAFYVLASMDKDGEIRKDIFEIGKEKYDQSCYSGILEME